MLTQIDRCKHSIQRKRIGPTSRKKSWMILVDDCIHCRMIVKSIHNLTWEQRNWIERWNRGILKENNAYTN